MADPDDSLHPRRQARADLLRRSRVMLLFTPELCRGGAGSSLALLDAVLPHIDVLQIRIKTGARDLFEGTQKVLDVLHAHVGLELPILVNDRVDVALALGAGDADGEVHGVHLGQDDLSGKDARALLGNSALIGRSTHDFAQVLLATEEPVDYLGFGPIFPTATKGYDRGVGSERAWMADTATHLTIFPIGGIDSLNVTELRPVGRVAVSSAILGAEDPVAAVKDLRSQLAG
jgi:thiamine-phosphate pyrophosphorylase